MNTIFSRIWTERRYEEAFAKAGKAHVNDRLRKSANLVMMLIAAGSVLLFFYEELTRDPAPWLTTANVVIDIVFLVDYVLRIAFSGMVTVPESSGERRRWQFSIARENYIVRWYGLIDLVAVAPPLLYHTVHIGLAIGEFSRLARLLRLLRLARMIRIIKTLRFLRETFAAQKRLLLHHQKIGTEVKAAFVVIGLVVMASAVLLHLQDETNPDFGDLGNSVYFAMLSLAGQGNPSELQSVGMRVVGLSIIFCGLALVGIITGSFTTLLMERVRMHTSGNRPYHGRDHLLICGYSHILPEILQLLAQDNEARDVVLLFDRKREHEAFIEETEYPCLKLGRPLGLHWLRGSGSDGGSLQRAQAHNASHILLLSDETSSITTNATETNAHSLMTLVQLHWLIRNGREHGREGSAIPVTVEYVGDTFEHGLTIGNDVALDLVSQTAETADALSRAIPEEIHDVLVCGFNPCAHQLIAALTARREPCRVRVLSDGEVGWNSRVHVFKGDPQRPSDLIGAGAGDAACVVLLADERHRQSADIDAQTLQTFATLNAAGVRSDVLIVAQVYQESVGGWIESSRAHPRKCVAVRTDVSIARALLQHVHSRG